MLDSGDISRLTSARSAGTRIRLRLATIVCITGFCLLTSSALAAGGEAHELRIIRMGTGGTGGTYFPIGSLIAQALSAGPPGEGAHDHGVPGVLVVPQISNGSVSNVQDLRKGLMEAALVQSDVAYWAFHGTAIFRDQPEYTELRAVANLYPESLHLVARKHSGIESVTDLRGRTVSLDEPGSGTEVDARIVLGFYGLQDTDFRAVYLKPFFAAQQIARNELDAFFLFAGYPAVAILDLAATAGARLVPISGPPVDAILREHPYFARGVIPAGIYGRGIIPAGTYSGVGDTPTLTVGAQLLMSSRLPDKLVYELTRALWSEHTRGKLIGGHPKGKEIRLTRAVEGITIPLHPGAERYYQEIGRLR